MTRVFSFPRESRSSSELTSAEPAMKRRALDFKEFLRKHGYDQVGNWALAQICHHVALPMNQYIDGFAFKKPRLLRLLEPPLIRKTSGSESSRRRHP